MYKVEMYLRVRRACFVEGMSTREAARVYGLHRDTVRKMLKYSVPPGYQRDRPPRRPKLDPYKGVIDQILEQDLTSPKKQRHTAKRIYERLRDEHGFPGKYTIVKDYVRERRRRTREMFVPLSHSPGHAQCDFGEARVIIGGVERKAHYFALDLPHSDGCYVKAYPAETTESFCDGHVSAFAFLGGVPQSILYDNTTLAVARILGDGRRQRTRVHHQSGLEGQRAGPIREVLQLQHVAGRRLQSTLWRCVHIRGQQGDRVRRNRPVTSRQAEALCLARSDISSCEAPTVAWRGTDSPCGGKREDQEDHQQDRHLTRTLLPTAPPPTEKFAVQYT